MSSNKEDIIKQYVSQLESIYPQGVYKKCVGEIAGISFNNIDVNNAGQILEDYLYIFGGMGRVVGQNYSWQSSIIQEIRKKSDILEELRHKELEDESLGRYEDNIEQCYDSFRNILLQVAAAKVLHLLCPKFFPPWERSIVRGYRRTISKSGNVEDLSGKDYYKFMEWIQQFIQNNSKLITELADYYGKTKVRIVDECLLYAVRNPFSLIV